MTIDTGTVELRDEPDGSTSVWVSGVPSSSMRPEYDLLDFEYMRHMAAAIDAWGPPDRALMLHVGAGVGTLPRYLAHAWGTSRHIAVDSDRALLDRAREWWDLPRAPRLRMRAQDGLAAVADRHEDSLDVVVRDAFAGADTPAHLADDAWWAAARRALRPGGVAVANVATRPDSGAHRADARAARAHFGSVVAIAEHAMLKGRRRGNVVLVCAEPGVVATEKLRRYAASAPLPTGVDERWAP